MTPLALALLASITFGGIAPTTNGGTKPAAYDSVVTMDFTAFPAWGSFWSGRIDTTAVRRRGQAAVFTRDVPLSPGNQYFVLKWAKRAGKAARPVRGDYWIVVDSVFVSVVNTDLATVQP